jgi:hypothetical protein
MSCQEVVFAHATCRLDVDDRTTDRTMPMFMVHMRLVDPDHSHSHDLVSDSGDKVEIHAPTEALAISTAIAYLSQHFGALSEYAHGCENVDYAMEAGPPVVVPFP